MKKYFQISSALTVLGLLIVIKQNNILDSFSKTSANEIINTANKASNTISSLPSISGTSYKDGTYIGGVQDAFYGNVQVQIRISGGKISDITFLQYPNDNHTSERINLQAMPLLISEALQSQSANINGVTGASATSPAFIASLTDALNQAK